MQRRKFSREFKVEAVRLVRERDVSVAQASRDIDVHENVVRKWVKEFGADPKQAFPGPTANGLPTLLMSGQPKVGSMLPRQSICCRVRVVGWSMKAEMNVQLVTDALLMAIWRRGRPDALLHHSDRGSQYTSEPFQRLMPTMASTAR
jgi:transposase